MTLRLGACAFAGLLLAGCPDPEAAPDAAPGAPDAAVADAPPPDAGPCGDQSFYTAAIVAWDSWDDDFHGGFGAVWTNAAVPSETATSAPNGRVELCLTRPTPTAELLLDIDLAGAVPTHVVVQPPDFVAPQNVLEARGLTPARATELYALAGATFDPAAGHALVFFPVDRVAVTADVAPGLTLVGDGDDAVAPYAWSVGDATSTGRYLLLGNIPLDAGPVTLSGLALGTDGELTVPLVAGELTIVNWVFAFE